MEDKTQIIMTSSDLPDPQNVGQAYQQSGDNNIMAPNYGTMNINVEQASFTVPQQQGGYPQGMPFGGMPYQIYVPPRVDREYYNLFVLGTEEFDKGYFKIPRTRALCEYMTEETKQLFSVMTVPVMERIKTLPSLFMQENQQYGAAGVDQQAIYGFVSDIKIYDDSIKIYFTGYRVDIPQQRLNELNEELAISAHKAYSELNRTHWAIKRVDLITELSEAGIQVPQLQYSHGG